MKKNLIFALIGGIILFIWQFISFAMPNIHESAMEYTPKQDQLLEAIDSLGLEEGMYVLGQPDPALVGDQEAYSKAMEQYEGKPWAVLNYQMNNSTAMGMNLVRGFIVCFIISLILFWMMKQMKDPTVTNRILLSLGVGFIVFLFVPYTSYIWFKEPDIWAYLADGIVPWIVLGFIGHKIAD